MATAIRARLLFDPTNDLSDAYKPAAGVRRGAWRCATCRTLPMCSSIPKARLSAATIGEDQPLSLGRRDPACLYAEKTKPSRVSPISLRSEASYRSHPQGDDDDAASGEAAFIPSSPARRVSCSTRARMNALAPLHRHVLSGLYRDPVVAKQQADAPGALATWSRASTRHPLSGGAAIRY